MPDFSAGQISGDLEAVYAVALERLDAIREAWLEEGAPLIGTGSTGQEVEHPLCRLLRDSEAHVARLGEAVRRRAPGRPTEAVIGSMIGKSPGAKVRAIKSAKGAGSRGAS
jgi:hypothetical protein